MDKISAFRTLTAAGAPQPQTFVISSVHEGHHLSGTRQLRRATSAEELEAAARVLDLGPSVVSFMQLPSLADRQCTACALRCRSNYISEVCGLPLCQCIHKNCIGLAIKMFDALSNSVDLNVQFLSTDHRKYLSANLPCRLRNGQPQPRQVSCLSAIGGASARTTLYLASHAGQRNW